MTSLPPLPDDLAHCTKVLAAAFALFRDAMEAAAEALGRVSPSIVEAIDAAVRTLAIYAPERVVVFGLLLQRRPRCEGVFDSAAEALAYCQKHPRHSPFEILGADGTWSSWPPQPVDLWLAAVRAEVQAQRRAEGTRGARGPSLLGSGPITWWHAPLFSPPSPTPPGTLSASRDMRFRLDPATPAWKISGPIRP